MANPKQKKSNTRNLNSAEREHDVPELNTEEADGSVSAIRLPEGKPKPKPKPKLPPPVRPQWLALGVSVVLFVGWLLFLAFVAYEVLS